MSKEDDMSMTEQSAIEAPAAKKPAPKKRRNAARKPVQAAAPKARDNLTGLTGSTCCADCGPEGCVISGINVCAHPRKGGLQGALMGDRAAIERLDRAKKWIMRQKD
jgi:hypothetical protein